LSFYAQALESQSALYAPTRAPVLLARYEMRSISFEASGPMQRRMVLSYEGVFAGRNEARGYFYTSTDHAKLIGLANPSLSRMPTTLRREEKLF
jgi:hypothetical protein